MHEIAPTVTHLMIAPCSRARSELTHPGWTATEHILSEWRLLSSLENRILPLKGVGVQANGFLASPLTSLLCKEDEFGGGRQNDSSHLSIIPVTLLERRERKPRWFLRRFKCLEGNSFSWGKLMSQGGYVDYPRWCICSE